jgi:Protein of unknown function (DUF3465)
MKTMLLILLLALFGAYEHFTHQSDSKISAIPATILEQAGSPVADVPVAKVPVITHESPSNQEQNSTPTNDAEISQAFANQQSGLQVSGIGTVIRVLPDDTEGGRHQKFILRLSTGQTLLIAHNIDLSTRIDSLQEGDLVKFYGQYEWNEKGGVVHWTHSDPNGKHLAGWLQHAGLKYQ